MYETATDNRRANMSIQQAKGAQANKQKGILQNLYFTCMPTSCTAPVDYFHGCPQSYPH